jgi:predicted metalloprotease
VIAHEYGHHIEDQLGVLGKLRTQQGANSDSVRVELMADCLAGVWANHASTTKVQSTNGGTTTALKPLTDKDIKDALSAASSVGDDSIQEKTQGRANPDTWTHGSSAARQKWFTTGYKSGDLNQCDTFSVATVE